jgi:hypothetical protein
MDKKKLTINFLYIENTFIYKTKELLKNKDNKFIIDYNSILDKSLDKTLPIKEKNVLIASLIIKKIKKIISKNNKNSLHIFYILSSFDIEKIKNLNKLVSQYFNGTIENNFFSDIKEYPEDELFELVYKPEMIKKNTFL